jgi:23S rRNA (pseudouridine1915-N3)-methyltransferase
LKIKLLQIGKTKERYLTEGISEYEKRISRYLPFEIVTIEDIKNAKNLSPDQVKEKEAELLQKQLEDAGRIILLDEKGKRMHSVAFSKFIQSQMNAGGKNIVFVIGGAYGFADSIYALANEKISLSEMTFSHQLVRLIFTEQLYRAFSILNNEPYHHE